MKWLGNRGDTIVEVLISIAVTGSLLVISYSIMNRSILVVRANQERSEATRIAQSQIESIRRLVREGDAAIANVPVLTQGFCITADGVRLVSSPPEAIDNDNLTDEGPYVPHCRVDDLYHFATIKLAADTYRVRVRWERIGGGPRNEVTMSYRVAP